MPLNHVATYQFQDEDGIKDTARNYHIVVAGVQHRAALGAGGGFSLDGLHWKYANIITVISQ